MASMQLIGALLGAWIGYRLATRSSQKSGAKPRGLALLVPAVLGGLVGAASMTAIGGMRGGTVAWSEAVKQVRTQADLDDVVTQAGSEAVLVDFYATWCGPCKATAPHIDALAKERNGRVAAVDVDLADDLVQEFGITSVPTLVVLRDGKEVQRALGYHDLDQLRELVSNS